MKLGFTAIELMVAISIAAILIIIGVPLLTSHLEANKLKASANLLSQQLRYAKSEAIRRNANITVVFTTGSSWCYGITTQTSCNCNTSNNCNLGAVTSQSFTHTSLIITGFSNNFTFEGTRGLASVAGSVQFTMNTKSIKVAFNRLGKIYQCSDNIGAYPTC